MRLVCVLVRQQAIERRVEAVGINLLRGDAQEVVQRRGAIPGVLDVEFAGRRAEAGDRENRGHLAPRDFFSALGDQLLEEAVEAEQSPEPQGQPDVAEMPHPLESKVAELDQDRLVIGGLVVVGRVEEGRLWSHPSLAVERATELRPAALLAA